MMAFMGALIHSRVPESLKQLLNARSTQARSEGGQPVHTGAASAGRTTGGAAVVM